MEKKDLEVFNQMPFLFWVKDAEGRYLWGNKVIKEAAQEDVTGKTDSQLIWAEDAKGLRDNDKEVLDSGQAVFHHETIEKSGRGKITLSVCKFPAEFEGKTQVFGVSFVIPDGK